MTKKTKKKNIPTKTDVNIDVDTLSQDEKKTDKNKNLERNALIIAISTVILSIIFIALSSNEETKPYLWLFGLIIIFLLPTIIAYTSKSPYRLSIALVNILLGWTFLGWVIALVWAVATKNKHSEESITPKETSKTETTPENKLKKLKELKDSKAITDEEFKTKKKELLDKI